MNRGSKGVTAVCETDFINSCIEKQLRVDGRGLKEGRSVDIAFSDQEGCCFVIQGNTKVLAQVSCEITAPTFSRPAEGTVNVNMELSPMAGPHLLGGRIFDASVEISRLLERCIRDSKCLDLESLCISAGEKVWTVKVDVQALNDDGNLIQCASVAAISALAHFKRPHVTVVGTDVKVHSLEDHNPVALSLHHMPLIVNLALFNNGQYILVDPTEVEERVSQGKVVIGMNAHQEMCLFHLKGALQLKKETVLKCTDIAVKQAQTLTKTIKTALDNFAYAKKTNKLTGFVNLLQTGTILGAKRCLPTVNVKHLEVVEDDQVEEIEYNAESLQPSVHEKNRITALRSQVEKFQKLPDVVMFQGGPSQWDISDEDSEENASECSDPVIDGKIKKEECGNEEDDVIMAAHHMDVKREKDTDSRGWYSKSGVL